MKKSLMVLFLVTVMTLPLFATDKGTKEINIKAGLNINPTATADLSELGSVEGGAVLDGNMQYRLGAEGYYFVKNNLGLGIGVERAFPTGYINEILARVDSVNVYASIKQELEITENKFIDGIYLFGRLGYGINNLESLYPSDLVSIDNGLYWALGIGFEKSSILFEVLYSVNYSKLNIKLDNGSGELVSASSDITVSAIGINIGYKFEL